ncbi:MAG: hypothetical protein Fur0023_02330 [Bacteroidia bacterium]
MNFFTPNKKTSSTLISRLLLLSFGLSVLLTVHHSLRNTNIFNTKSHSYIQNRDNAESFNALFVENEDDDETSINLEWAFKAISNFVLYTLFAALITIIICYALWKNILYSFTNKVYLKNLCLRN